MVLHPSSIRPGEAFARAARFFYLLWGGMLLLSVVFRHRLLIPDFMWHWSGVIRFLNLPWGKALLFGIGVTMSLAALFEAWELVDRLLMHLTHHRRQKQMGSTPSWGRERS